MIMVVVAVFYVFIKPIWDELHILSILCSFKMIDSNERRGYLNVQIKILRRKI